MDGGEVFCDDGTDAKVQRRESCVLAARALPVIVAADDKPAAPLKGSVVELGVLAAEHVLRTLGNVRPEAHPQSPVRSHVARRDIVLDHNQDAALQSVGQRFTLRRGYNVRSAHDLDALYLIGWWRAQDLAIVHPRVGRRRGYLRRISQGTRVRDLALQCRGSGCRRRAEVDLVTRRSAP